jgi:hypothetical protein
MAYVSQELKKSLSTSIKVVLKKFKMKGTIAVRHHSTLVVNISQGALDVIGNLKKTTGKEFTYQYVDVNPYSIDQNYSGKVKQFLVELKSAMMQGNHNNSDIQTDYFDVGWYIDINVGQWNKPYVCTK